MNRTLSHLDALLERRNLSGGDRLAALNRSIDSIERKLGNMGNVAVGGNQAQSPTGGMTKFEELERRVRELTNGVGGQGNRSIPEQQSGQTGFNAWSNNSGSGNLLAEIAERKRALNNSTQIPPQIPPMQNYHQGVQLAEAVQSQHASAMAAQAAIAQAASEARQVATDKIHEMSQRIDALRVELANELNGISKSVAQNTESLSSTEDLDRIAQGIRELQQAPRYDPAAFDNLHNELEELRMSLGSSVRHEEFNNGINDLNVRLDQISDNMNQSDSAELSEIKKHLELINSNTATDNTAVLMSRIDTLSQLVDKQSNADVVEKLDQRLQSLVEMVGSMANKPQPDENDDSAFQAIEARLDEITRAIVAVSVTEQNPVPADNEALARLEGQITALAQGIESVVRKNDDDQFAQLTSRIENLAGNLESMDASIQNAATAPGSSISSEIENQLRELASRLDMGAVEKHRDEDQLSHLATRIDGLTEKFSSFAIAAASGDAANAVPVTVVSDNSQIEYQLQQLADRLDSAINGNSADNQLQNLELQIAQIAEKLGSVSPTVVDLGGVESRLGVIEQNLDAGRDFTLEAAAKAAQSAVEMMGDQGLSGELINALAEDLRGLQTAASQTESRTIESIGNVQAALKTMVDRLGSIETQLKDGANAAIPAAAVFAKKNLVAAEFAETSPIPTLNEKDLADPLSKVAVEPEGLEQISHAPSIDPVDELHRGSPNKAEDNRPLEPGSGAPDIADLVKRASDKLTGADASPDVGIDKTDFVAAARRAAQAAVSEVQAVKVEAETEAKVKGSPQSASLLSKLKEVPRKSIIIAAAAVLMAVIAFAGSKILFNDGGETAVVAVNPVAVEEPMTSFVETPAIKNNFAEASVPIVRPAVSNAAPVDGSMALAEKTGGINKPSGETEAVANVMSNFNVGAQPKHTDSFKEPTGPEMVASTSSAETNGAEPELMASASNNNITSAPLPPVQLGSTALRKAAATGDVRAQHEVALRYTNGTGTKRDLGEAAKWYERAAALEFAPAQYRLGSLYEKGLGVKRDLGTAMNWYARAAEQGNARAMHNLAVISAMGASGNPDMSKALTWFTKAANYGVKDSQFNLGILHGQGMGVKQDLAQSYKWFALAAKTGDTDAAKKRDEVANVMDPKALEKSRIIVRDWRPENLVTSANQVTIPEEWRGIAIIKNASLSRKETIRQTQMTLNKLGYSVGAPDGKFGPKTRNAIVNFQRKAGLSPTGTIDAELVKALKGLSI